MNRDIDHWVSSKKGDESSETDESFKSLVSMKYYNLFTAVPPNS
jgi:hypothetical protein